MMTGGDHIAEVLEFTVDREIVGVDVCREVNLSNDIYTS
jgi:hypothetical protein